MYVGRSNLLYEAMFQRKHMHMTIYLITNYKTKQQELLNVGHQIRRHKEIKQEFKTVLIM